MSVPVTLSLISHTNVGKTTLARTLLRRDVGEVLDQAHVTETPERHTLIETDGAVLRLWDTPGFGNLAPLMGRLRRENEPLGWFLHQVWDRLVNRPLWCSQEAVRNVRDEADAVLYLVNATESPADAGYVGPELELLSWIDRPVLVLLNQVGGDPRALVEAWKEHTSRWPVVRDVLSLDAFARCWVEESVLLERVADVLPPDKRSAMHELAAAWNRRNLEVFHRACDHLTRYLVRTALDREEPGRSVEDGEPRSVLGDVARALQFSALDKRRAMAALNRRLDRATRELMATLIAEHDLYGESAAKIERRILDFQVRGATPVNERSGALAGAVLSGALGGLTADALAGGLTLGGGMIAGAILGALGGAAFGRVYRMVGGDAKPRVTWAAGFLDQLTRQALLRYLAVAHFGRGRGTYRDLEQPAYWAEAVERALALHADALERAWTEAERSADAESLHRRLRAVIEGSARAVLQDAYPHAAKLLSPG